MSKLVIFDADSMVFTVAYRYRDKKAKHLVTMNLNKYISDVIKNSGATHYIGFYGSKEDGGVPNFRYNIYPKYKANRPETPEWVEKWRPTLHNEMKNKWGFVPVDGMEADDAASVAAHYFKGEYDEIVVATEDKDLKQIPDIYYYNFRKHSMEYIPEIEGHRHLAIQTLSGDSTDNIPGLPGIGPKKALNFVKDCTTKIELQKAVLSAYKQSFNTLLAKLQLTNKVVTEEDLKAEYEDKGISLSNKQIQRKLKILNKGAGDEIYETFPGGWKAFLRLNYSLVRLLVDTTELPPNFDMPEPVESKITPKKEDNDKLEEAKKAIFGDSISNDIEEDTATDEDTDKKDVEESVEKVKPSKIEKLNEKIAEKIEQVAPTKVVTVSVTPSSGDIMSL
jgi:5'-3' exonuclease